MENKEFLFVDVVKDKEFFMNKDIEITSLSPYDDVMFNEGLRGKIVDVRIEEEGTEDAYLDILIDFDVYRESNIPKMKKSFYDDHRNPVLTWYDSDFYKKGIDSIFVSIHPSKIDDRDRANRFVFVNEKKQYLYQMFKESGMESYYEFLENVVLS